MFLSDACNLKLPAMSIHIQKAVMEMCQVAREKTIYKDLEGTWRALTLFAWIMHKCVCFWVTLGYFLPGLFQVTLSQVFVICITQSTNLYLHKWSITILRLKWPVKTNNLFILWRKNKRQFQLKVLLWDFTQAIGFKFIRKLWSESWENILKKKCNPPITGHPCGWMGCRSMVGP